MNKEKYFVFSMLFVSIITFFAFGFFHLAKFETTDEHLWKYGRIKQYWKALENKDWEKTYINDKPGVTVALVSGIGLLGEPNPETKQIIPAEKTFEKYDTQQSERINFLFRLPILIFSSLSLLLFFWLALKIFNNYYASLIATLLIALNPIILGMSQIINPDSFFWIFGGLSVFSYLAFLNSNKRKFLYLCGLLMGFALLSKYTSFILFLFFVIGAVSKTIFQHKSLQDNDWKKLLLQGKDIAIIFLISIAVFSILLPAVFINPNYLFKGISQFISFKNFLLILLLVTFFSLFLFYIRKRINFLIAVISKHKTKIYYAACVLFSLLILASLINVWTGQQFARVDALRDAAYANEPKEFNFKPLINKDTNILAKNLELFFMEAYPFIFSLSPLIIILILFTAFGLFKKQKVNENSYIIFTIFSFTILYFASTVFAGIITNVRYSIVLYPIFALFGSIAISQLGKKIKFPKLNFNLLFIVIYFSLSIISLWSLRPFYFSYANFLLPSQFSIHDSWGHGAYEAAQYLNSQPNAKELVIWSNSDTVCRFFKGKCLRNRKIDLNVVTPDYFVVSKRGEIKLSNRFILLNNPKKENDSDYYFENLKENFEWQLLINNRPDNYIKVVKFEK